MKRGFTLIEVAMVLPFVLLLATVSLQLYMSAISSLQTAALQSDMRQDMRRAAASIYARARACGWKIDADNRGVRFGDGQAVRWSEQHLRLGQRSLLTQPVGLFLATALDGQLVLTLEVTAPNHWRGQSQAQRMVFEGDPR